MTNFRRILIIKPSSLGDVVHALPTLAALRQTFPHAHIAWLVKRQWAGLLERVEGLDAVWPVESGVTGWVSAIRRLRAARFDLAVDLQGLLRSGAMARLAGCPPEFFATTMDHLQEKGLGRVVLIGGPDDRAAAQAVKGLLRTVPMDLTGATAPGLLPALLESAALLLTNDSGPMHVAAAMGTPVVALFGPTSPTRTGPYGNGHRVLRSGVPCSPCFSRTCRNTVYLECLKTISPDKVIEAVRDQLKRDNGVKGLHGVADISLPTSTPVSRYPVAPK